MRTRLITTLSFFVVSLFYFPTIINAQQYSGYPKNISRTLQYYTWVQNPKEPASFKPVKNYSRNDIVNGMNCLQSSVISRIGQLSVYNGDVTEISNISARVAYQWDFSGIMNPNAVVTGVRLEIWYLGDGGCNVSVRQLDTYEYDLDAAGRWSAIKSGTEYTDFISIKNQYPPSNYIYLDLPVSNKICEDLSDAIRAGAKYSLALMVEGDEEWPDMEQILTGSIQTNNNNNGCEGLKLTINYKIPVNITVQNSFGAGRLLVDGDTVNSGTTFTWYSNESHTMKAFSQYLNNGKYYPLKSSGMWLKNGSQFSGSNINPLQVQTSENAVYQSCFELPDMPVTVNQTLSSGHNTTAKIGHWKNGPVFDEYNVPNQFIFQ